MRILIVLTRANLGGVAKYVAKLAQAFKADGNEVLIVMGEVQDSEIEDPVMLGLPICRLPSMGREISPLKDFKTLTSFKAIIKEFQPDIIHSHTSKAGFVSRIISKSWYRKHGDPVRVHTFHGHSFSEPEFRGVTRRFFLALEKILAKRADGLISVGENIKCELQELEVGSKNFFISIPPGVESPSIISQKKARNLFALKEKGCVIAWIGRMSGVKNPHAVLNFAKKLPNITFVMAGGGELLDEIKNIAPANVTVLGWADSNIVLSACDIVLLTSYHEGMPLALIEAQMAGKPVVATNVGSVSEVILNRETGFVGAQSQLIEFLELLSSSPKLREEMGAQACKRAHELFTIERMVEKHRTLYGELTKANQL